MAAIVLSLVYRQVQHLTDVLRMLETEGLLWVESMSVSRQALSQRLNSLPAHLFAQLFEQVVERMAMNIATSTVRPEWAGVAKQFGTVWIADASTLEALMCATSRCGCSLVVIAIATKSSTWECITPIPVAIRCA